VDYRSLKDGICRVGFIEMDGVFVACCFCKIYYVLLRKGEGVVEGVADGGFINHVMVLWDKGRF